MSDERPVAAVFSPQVDQLLPALFAFQRDCPNVPKRQPATIPGREGKSGFSYKYANIADVRDHVLKHLQANGLLFVQPPSGHEIVTRVFHVASGQWIEGRMPYPATERNAQALGGAITYVRRFALLAVLGLAGEDDDDDGAAAARAANEDRRPPRQERAPAAQRAQRQGAAAPPGRPATATMIVDQIAGAKNWTDACAALKLGRDTLRGTPAIEDVEAAFADLAVRGLDRAADMAAVDKITKVVADVGSKRGALILAAAQQAKARIEAGT